jgi:anti-sigma factor RsiW
MQDRCREFRRSLLLSVSGPEPTHPLGCNRCHAFEASLRQTRVLLRAAAGSWQPSEALRRRVVETVERERSRADARRGARSRLRLEVAAAVSLAAAILVAFTWSATHTGRHNAATVAQGLVDDFLDYAPAGPEKLQVASADPAVIEAFFARHVRIAARLPALREAVLSGGRRCDLDGRPAALAFFERSGLGVATPISLFAFEPRGEDFSKLAPVPGAPRYRQLSLRGVTVILWQERGLVYALAGALDAPELVQLLEEGGR